MPQSPADPHLYLMNNHSLNIMANEPNGLSTGTPGDWKTPKHNDKVIDTDDGKFIGWNSGSVWSPSPTERLKLGTKTASDVCVDSFCITPDPTQTLNGFFSDSPPPLGASTPGSTSSSGVNGSLSSFRNDSHPTGLAAAPSRAVVDRFVFPPPGVDSGTHSASASMPASPLTQMYSPAAPHNQPRPITAYNKAAHPPLGRQMPSRSFDICSSSTHSSLSVSPVSDTENRYECEQNGSVGAAGRNASGQTSVTPNVAQSENRSDIEDILSPQELQELKEALFLNNDRPRPPFTYVCDCCKARGDHYISDCHLRVMQQCSPNAHTPYQGSNESFGYFKCTACSHRWQSTRCFANVSQHCKKCNTPVYPMKMFSHQKAIQKGLMPSRRQGSVSSDVLCK